MLSAMLKIITPKRRPDGYGSGEFGASRGARTHQGVDYACLAGSDLLSPVSGRVTKLGYPYADDLQYRYVEITDPDLNRHRFFYVEPATDLGALIDPGELIGTVQDIGQRYSDRDMTCHVHYEIIDDAGEYRNPEIFP